MNWKKFQMFVRPMSLFIEGDGVGDGGGDATTAERALDYLNTAEGEGTPAAPAAGDGKPPVKDDGPDPAAVAAAAEEAGKLAAAQPAAAQPAAQQPPATTIDPQKWLESEPVKQVITAGLGDYAKDVTSPQQLQAVLKDAAEFYAIADGKQSPDAMVQLLKQHWPKALDALASSAAAAVGMKLAKPEDLKEAGPKDPALERVEKMEREWKEAKEREDAQRVETHRRETFDKFTGEINKIVAKNFEGVEALENGKGVLAGLGDLYMNRISLMINGNQEILGRIEKGNYTDVEKFATQVHNEMLGYLQAWSKALVARKSARDKGNPRIPANGAPPAPTGSPRKFNPANPDERMAAAAEYLAGSTEQ